MKPDWLVYHNFFLNRMQQKFIFRPQGKEWALREAHLEIARRKQAGLPLISKDLVDPKRVALSLPSDEELRDFEILI